MKKIIIFILSFCSITLAFAQSGVSTITHFYGEGILKAANKLQHSENTVHQSLADSLLPTSFFCTTFDGSKSQQTEINQVSNLRLKNSSQIQSFSIDTLFISNSPKKRNLIFIPAGFTEAELPMFKAYVEYITSNINLLIPNLTFSAVVVNVPNLQIIDQDQFINTNFPPSIYPYANRIFAWIENSPNYFAYAGLWSDGTSNGRHLGQSVGVGQNGRFVLAHELGHVFGLGDINDSNYTKIELANITQKTQLNDIVWKDQIKAGIALPTPRGPRYTTITDDIGLYPIFNGFGTTQPSGWYKPCSNGCIMEAPGVGPSFCKVCGKAVDKNDNLPFLTVENGSFGGYFFPGQNVVLNAKAPDKDFKFSHWQSSDFIINNPTNPTITINMTNANSSIEAVFELKSVDYDGDGLSYYQETNVCRDDSNTSDFSMDFDQVYESSNTFNTANITNFSIKNGIMSGTSLGDAQLYQNTKYLFKGRLVPKLIVKIKANVANALQLLWANEDGGFSESRSITTPYTANNDWQYLEIDLSSHPQWMTKTIRQLRIDPANAANVSFEIDWIRAIDYSDCTCSGNATASLIFNNSEWSYYGIAGNTDPLFAIQHTPAGGNTLPFTAEIRLNKPCLENYGIVGITNYNSKEATLVAGNYWNISLTSGTTNGFVNIRHFTNTTLNNQLDTESNNFYTISGATQQSPSIYFKTNSPLQLPQDLRADGKGLNYGFSALLPAQTGIFNGKNFVQFNQISDINNSGGGLLKRVTNLNENSYLSAQDMLKLKGTLRYNKVFDRFEGFDGLVWKPLH